MSALSALKGYRTQFLYSLHYILANKHAPNTYRLEGKEDLDVLDGQGKILYAIQIKNLSKTIGLSDLVSQQRTSFLKRSAEIYPDSIPVLASFGSIHQELMKWKDRPSQHTQNEKAMFQKAGISAAQLSTIKEKLQIVEINEEQLTREILELLKAHQSVDPVPTAENLLYYIQCAAEKQQLIGTLDLIQQIDRIGEYLSERIAIANQYGLFIRPLLKTEPSAEEQEKLRAEFFYGISARYEHIGMDLDVLREGFLDSVYQAIEKQNIVIISGASGQGKSTLAYRYVESHCASGLAYEIILQEDPVKVGEAINAIAAMSKGLSVPIYIVLHVAPNTISWLRIARRFAAHPHLRLLVTIRNEDWFRAQSSEMDFMHIGVELELTAKEAEQIFARLDQRGMIRSHNDFQDAWAELGDGVPLLEFVHSVTQGSSLREKLRAQLAQLTIEETARPIGQLHLLRLISLCDSFGARVEISQLRDVPNIKLIIDKFEKEYLLKRSDDRKYLTGLHPVRSALMTELLFDEFIVTKTDYITSCLQVIEQQDAYTFMLQALYQKVSTPDQLIADMEKSGQSSWTLHAAATKSLLWSGIRGYVDNNAALIDEVHRKCGDAWYIVIDIYQGNVLDLDEVLGSLPGDNSALLDHLRGVQSRLSPKEEVYAPIVALFDRLPFPAFPASYQEHASFAEALFWIAVTPNVAKNKLSPSEEQFRSAFEQLDIEPLSQLMMGMHHHSEKMDSIRTKLAPIFDGKLREEYQIPRISHDQGLHFDFIIDMTREEQTYGWHERTITMIDLLRTAYPEKSFIGSQGHGHRMDLLPAYHDETSKNIPAKNLPLAAWVGINSNLLALVNFQHRPEDWQDFHHQLGQWEKQIKEILSTFQKSFQTFKRENRFAILAPVADQAHYQSLTSLYAPKNTVDPLGIPASNRSNIQKQWQDPKQGPKDNREDYLQKKYDPFLKSYNDFKRAVETFITQSGRSCYDGAKNVVDNGHPLDEHLRHLSYVNLQDAVEKRAAFQQQREVLFPRFSGPNTGVSDMDLFQTATIWKGFWTTIETSDLKRMRLSEKITELKNDFLQSLNKSIKAAKKGGKAVFSIRYDSSTNHLPIISIHSSDPLEAALNLRMAYQLIYQCVGSPEYSSLKHLMLRRFFSKFCILSEIAGYPFDLSWQEFPLHVLSDKTFDELNLVWFMPKEIPVEIVSSLKLKSWISLRPEAKKVMEIAKGFQLLKLHLGHLADLSFFDQNEQLDELGASIVERHIEHADQVLLENWNRLLENLSVLAEELPEDPDEDMSEYDQQYWILLRDVLTAITPSESELQKKFFNMQAFKLWSEKLARLNETWGMFLLHLQGQMMR